VSSRIAPSSTPPRPSCRVSSRRRASYSRRNRSGASPMRHALLATAAAAILSISASGSGRAETLIEALVDAYNNNPQILAERANLRATDEAVPQALSGWRPTVTFTGSIGAQHVEDKPPSFNVGGPIPRVADLNIAQPVYTGGRTVALTAQAEKTVEAERARNIA